MVTLHIRTKTGALVLCEKKGRGRESIESLVPGAGHELEGWDRSHLDQGEIAKREMREVKMTTQSPYWTTEGHWCPLLG
jgi:hypothetical protein